MLRHHHENMHTPLRVGFDLDGVLLYNPARVFRPITISLKKILPQKPNRSPTDFYYPKTQLEQVLWRIVHWSSVCIAPGFDEIEALVQKNAIEAHIITSRYDCLKDDFNKWVKKLNRHNTFKSTYHNSQNIQPHRFKVQKIRELKLDMFVEDNWNIVQAITMNTPTKALWITNQFDRTIRYPYKYNSLRDALSYIHSQIE